MDEEKLMPFFLLIIRQAVVVQAANPQAAGDLARHHLPSREIVGRRPEDPHAYRLWSTGEVAILSAAEVNLKQAAGLLLQRQQALLGSPEEE